jgi:hypothetical protein
MFGIENMVKKSHLKLKKDKKNIKDEMRMPIHLIRYWKKK